MSSENIIATDRSVAVGTAQDGSQIFVFNRAVPDELVARLARGTRLSVERSEQVTGDFLRYIEKYYRYLPLKGMGDNSGLRLRFPLVELFVPLNGRLTLPRGADTLSDELRIAGRRLSEEEVEQIGGRPDEPRPVLDLVREHPVLVILGDPGSGKSTVLKFIALMLATGQGTPFGLNRYLPLLLPLASYSEQLEKKPDLSLRGFVMDYFRDHLEVEDLDCLLERKLDEGQVVILLDGLDEVKEVGQRNTVVQRVQGFLCRYIDKGNRFVMTSRIIGYQEVRPPEIEGLRECTLLDFGDEEIESFIKRWTRIVEWQARKDLAVSSTEAERESKELLDSLETHPAVRKLASNPLLLTMLVIQKRQGVALPRHRVKLYEQYIESLLRDWLLARPLQGVPRGLPNDAVLRKTLVPLAWWMQVSEPGKGVVNEADMRRWLRDHFAYRDDPDQAAQVFVRDVREHSGLLIDRGGRRFGFLHLTFMEYLAGVALADQLQQGDGDGVARIVDLITEHAGASEWHEVILLAIGYLGLKQNWDRVATRVLSCLMDTPANTPGTHHAIVAHGLADMGADGVTPEGWGDLRKRLVTEGLRGAKIPAKIRVDIGAQLAAAGDPRSAVLDVDAMLFCRVPAGAFFLGSTEEDGLSEDDEKNGAGEHNIDYDYWLARFPVTVAQFRRFVEDETEFRPGDPDCLAGPPNTPVVFVSWEEAMAFCAWLDRRWREKGWLPEGYRLSLPSEPEWEKGAKGGYRIPLADRSVTTPINELRQGHPGQSEGAAPALEENPLTRRLYPWGDNLDVECLNYNMNIGQVSPVGAYPGGASPYGCEEMSGNVWEWTRSLWGAYPYPEDGEGRRQREGDGNGRRVLRGGAFISSRWLVRCAFRNFYVPSRRSHFCGFRVVLSPLR